MVKLLRDWLALPRVVWHLMRQSPQARATLVGMWREHPRRTPGR